MSPDELEAFEPLVAILDPGRRKGVRDPMYIEQANANLWGITVITIKSVDSPAPPPGGFWVIGIDAEEWTPEPKEVKPGAKKPKKKSEPAGPSFADDFLKPQPQPFSAAQAAQDLVGPPSDAAESGLGL
jgi:hypothetical protein